MKAQLVLPKTRFGRGLATDKCIARLIKSNEFLEVIGCVESVLELSGVYVLKLDIRQECKCTSDEGELK